MDTTPTAAELQWQAERLRLGDNVLAAPAPARAKPLNANTLAALPYGVTVWNDQIEYLADIIANADFATRNAAFRDRIRRQHADLIRARDWLQSKIDSKGE